MSYPLAWNVSSGNYQNFKILPRLIFEAFMPQRLKTEVANLLRTLRLLWPQIFRNYSLCKGPTFILVPFFTGSSGCPRNGTWQTFPTPNFCRDTMSLCSKEQSRLKNNILTKDAFCRHTLVQQSLPLQLPKPLQLPVQPPQLPRPQFRMTERAERSGLSIIWKQSKKK